MFLVSQYEPETQGQVVLVQQQFTSWQARLGGTRAQGAKNQFVPTWPLSG